MNVGFAILIKVIKCILSFAASSNKLIRPLAKYKGSKYRKVMLLNQR